MVSVTADQVKPGNLRTDDEPREDLSADGDLDAVRRLLDTPLRPGAIQNELQARPAHAIGTGSARAQGCGDAPASRRIRLGGGCRPREARPSDALHRAEAPRPRPGIDGESSVGVAEYRGRHGVWDAAGEEQGGGPVA